MISIEDYYEIKKFSDDQLRRIKQYSRHREHLSDPKFLSAKHSCLIGEKGVGKTVLACQKAISICENQDKATDVLYISLDDTLFSSYSMVDIAKIAEQHNIKLLIFDEIHRYPNWKAELKSICDRMNIHTIISGSSILSFDDLGGLSRRIVKYDLKGLSFREYLNLAYQIELNKVSLEEILKTSPSLGPRVQHTIESVSNSKLGLLFEEYVTKGYYAYSLDEDDLETFLKMLRQSTEDTIAYEIVLSQTYSRPDMARKLQMLFKAVAQNVPYTVNYQSLKDYTGIKDLRTLKHYLACLEKAGMISSLEKTTLKSLKKADKLYLGNTSLYFAYSNLNPNIGSLRETFFLNCLRLAGLEARSHEGRADFSVSDFVFEVGGPGKGRQQIRELANAYLVKDIKDSSLDPNIIPLWLFGLLA